MNDFDREIKKSKECIEKSMMNNPQDIYMSSNKTEKRKFSAFKTKMAFKYAVCLLIIAMVSVLSIVLLNDDNHEKEDEFIVPPISENVDLLRFPQFQLRGSERGADALQKR